MSAKRNSKSKSNAAKYTYQQNPLLKSLTEQSLREAEAAVARQERERAAAQREREAKAAEAAKTSPKYYLTNEVITVDGHKLHRIQAARDIPEIGVEEGDLGGFVESERNLSHQGTAWVFSGKVYEMAVVKDGATVRGENVRVHDRAELSGGFVAYDEAHLHGNFRGTGCAKAAERADASDSTILTGSSYLTDGAIMRGHAKLSGNSRAAGNAILTGTVTFTGNYEAFTGHYSEGVLGRNPGEKPERDTSFKDVR